MSGTNDAGDGSHGIWMPPRSGPNKGTPGYAEVVVQYNQKRYFSALWGSGTYPIRARAVARGYLGPLSASILVLSQSASPPAVDINGNAHINDPGKIVIDGVLNVNGNSGSIVGGEIDVARGITGSTSNVNAPSAGSTTNVFPNTNTFTPDPLGPSGINLAQPTPSGTVRSTSQLSTSNGQVLQPGIYIGGFSVKKSVQMATGTYYIEGGSVDVQTANGTLTSQTGGVLIYLTKDSSGSYASFDLQGNATANLSPLTAGPYAGITIFQDRNAPVGSPITIQGGSNSNLLGMVYAPQAALSLSGGNTAAGDSFIVNTLSLSGNNNLTVPTPKTPVNATRYFGLVE